MALLLETTLGDLVIDLDIDGSADLAKNILKLAKARYYTSTLIYNVQPNRFCQLGDPHGDGSGGACIYGLLSSLSDNNNNNNNDLNKKVLESSQRFMKSDRGRQLSKEECKQRGRVVATEMNGIADTIGSQFLITITEGPDMALDGYLPQGTKEDNNNNPRNKFLSVGMVTEDENNVLDKIATTYCDAQGRPYADIRVRRVLVIDDPFEDPPGMEQLLQTMGVTIRDGQVTQSPNHTRPLVEAVETRIEADQLEMGHGDNDDEEQDEQEAIKHQEEIKKKEDKSRAVVLEMLGDLPSAEIKAPENVLFVCKLNPITEDEDLELIFSRFDQNVKAEIIRDNDTGNSLQYAFIEFTKKEQAVEAYFKMNNALVDDRRIKVDFSQSVAKMWDKYTQRMRQPPPPPPASKRIDSRKFEQSKGYHNHRSSSSSSLLSSNNVHREQKRDGRSRNYNDNDNNNGNGRVGRSSGQYKSGVTKSHERQSSFRRNQTESVTSKNNNNNNNEEFTSKGSSNATTPLFFDEFGREIKRPRIPEHNQSSYRDRQRFDEERHGKPTLRHQQQKNNDYNNYDKIKNKNSQYHHQERQQRYTSSSPSPANDDNYYNSKSPNRNSNDNRKRRRHDRDYKKHRVNNNNDDGDRDSKGGDRHRHRRSRDRSHNKRSNKRRRSCSRSKESETSTTGNNGPTSRKSHYRHDTSDDDDDEKIIKADYYRKNNDQQRPSSSGDDSSSNYKRSRHRKQHSERSHKSRDRKGRGRDKDREKDRRKRHYREYSSTDESSTKYKKSSREQRRDRDDERDRSRRREKKSSSHKHKRR